MSFSNSLLPCTRCCGQYECVCCAKRTFPNSYALIKHLRKSFAHKEKNESFWCALCEESFQSKVGYILHLKQKRIHKYDLHQAACCGRFQDVGHLIHTEDADVTGASHKVKPANSPRQLGMTPMHCAAFMGYSRCLKVMLSWPDGNPNIPDELGQTPVHLAARRGRASSLRLLLDSGGNLGKRDKNGENPIRLANDDDDCMDVILGYQISAMIAKYRLKEVKAKKSMDFGESGITEADDDSSGSGSSLSETGEYSQNCGDSSKDDDETVEGAVCPEKITISSRFTATLPFTASIDDNDLSSPQMLPTDKMVESQHGETNSKGNLTTMCSGLKHDDETGKELDGTKNIITKVQDIKNVYAGE
ncbi:ankyrin repeat-containing [Paramuricea clavata]|uniref:Ankyrin repeat-containing n=1 Tax=Paramuricea clavata TaxID=317549 RepID=A0A7D9HQZ1_PARCT|nr:ankyrin repeat-containing [Paramuricea clavata]